MVKKISVILTILLATLFLFHNAHYYSPNAGYDAALHSNYAEIISNQRRIPDLSESREAYNPPLYYLISGNIVRTASIITGNDFVTSLKAWQYFGIILSLVSFYLWFKIFDNLHPNNKALSVMSILLLFSLPVFHKTVVMFSLELFFFFLSSLFFYYWILIFQPKPNYKKLLALSSIVIVLLLTRMSAVVHLITSIVGFVGLGLISKLSWKQVIKYTSVFMILVAIGTGWFYIGRRDKDIYGVGEGNEKQETPFFKRQPLSFYFDIPFKFMMTHPIRLSQPINQLIPVYYSDFWGDYWNYYPQRRTGITTQDVRKDRLFTTPERVSRLALQNQINLLPTLVMIAGFVYFIVFSIKKTFSNPDSQWLIYSFFVIFTLLTWAGFIVLLTKYPSWKGDSIKPSYMIYILPILTYSLSVFIFKIIKPIKILFIPIVIWLAIASINNLWFSWF